MTEHDYTLAWGLYAVAALGCLLVGFKLTGWMWRWLREPLRVIIAVLLFSPTIVDPVKESFAPAIAITALDVAFKVGNNAWRAASDLAMYGMLAFALYIVFVLIRWPLEKRARERRAQREAAAQRQVKEEQEVVAEASLAANRQDRYRDDPPPAPVRRSGPGQGRVEPRL
ncbi:MFS transporter [Pseudomonas mosselii]|uniref:MFS transporter n=1 Tax=Pseudomonas mosselii TaxID=78327 RepID=UPI000A1008B6|nr:MFS transporter [Pseudomonas mosselii]ATB66700.1 MFS transporter [Pseudomonas mosselii]MDH1100264.1 MFS transporter [Pseudomonas mosselii]MDN4500734.1 MFS transporter [Pseudomonas mosselii]MEA3236150.1 MFS transporter [Pseudomonas mosselii]MEB5932995.1 MFS transporter [Pseudomonas mosselii]